MNDQNKISDSSDIANAFDSMRTHLRNIRLTGLGVVNKFNKEAKGYIDGVKARGEDKLEEISDINSNKLFDRASVAMAKVINQSRAYGLATYEDANDNRQKLADWIKTAVDTVIGDETESISRLGRNVEMTNKVVNSLAMDAYESAERFLQDAKEIGRDVDHELRKVVFTQQASLEERIHNFWKAIGLVNKRELEELNRKLVTLAESVESQLDEDSKMLIYLNRRKADRRIKRVAVDVDRRVRLRRETDKKLAS